MQNKVLTSFVIKMQRQYNIIETLDVVHMFWKKCSNFHYQTDFGSKKLVGIPLNNVSVVFPVLIEMSKLYPLNMSLKLRAIIYPAKFNYIIGQKGI